MSDGTESPDQKRLRYMRLAAQAAKLGVGDKRIEVRESGLTLAETWLELARAVDDLQQRHASDDELDLGAERGADASVTSDRASPGA